VILNKFFLVGFVLIFANNNNLNYQKRKDPIVPNKGMYIETSGKETNRLHLVLLRGCCQFNTNGERL
jgi:hypothetical protein